MEKVCPKCKAKMIKGRMKDSTYGGVIQQRWTEETKSLWWNNGTKVDAYACEKCGFIEAYLQK